MEWIALAVIVVGAGIKCYNMYDNYKHAKKLQHNNHHDDHPALMEGDVTVKTQDGSEVTFSHIKIGQGQTSNKSSEGNGGNGPDVGALTDDPMLLVASVGVELVGNLGTTAARVFNRSPSPSSSATSEAAPPNKTANPGFFSSMLNGAKSFISSIFSWGSNSDSCKAEYTKISTDDPDSGANIGSHDISGSEGDSETITTPVDKVVVGAVASPVADGNTVA